MSTPPIAAATPTHLNVRAGLVAAIAGGMLGALSAALAVLLFSVAAHWYDAMFQKDLAAGRIWTVDIAIGPIVGCSAAMAAAGWLTYAIRPSMRFVLSLGIVVCGTVFIWMWLSVAEITPYRMKSHPPALITLSEFFYLVMPPALTAILATFWRIR